MIDNVVIQTEQRATKERNCLICKHCHSSNYGSVCMRDFSECNANRCCIFYINDLNK